MKFKEIYSKSGSPSEYLLYFGILFLWYLLDNAYSRSIPGLPEISIDVILGSFIMAGIYGGVYEKQRTGEISRKRGFIVGVKQEYWRFIVAYLPSIAFYLMIFVPLSISIQPNRLEVNQPVYGLLFVPISAITMFWYAGITVNRKIFRGLQRGIKLLFNPYALAIGLFWGALSFADVAIRDSIGDQIPIALNALLSGVLAAGRIISIAFALVLYAQVHGAALDEAPGEIKIDEPSSSPASGNGLVNASFGFAFIAFLPLIHFVTLTLGILAIRRKKRIVLRSAIACCLGAFFTLFYFMIILGWIVVGSSPSNSPGYAFLSEANADLDQQVSLIDQGEVQEIQHQLEPKLLNQNERNWTVDSLIALSKVRANDLDGALEDFRSAAQKNPDRSEFYYYYGITLLQDGQIEPAKAQFQTALAQDPEFEIADRYLTLLNSTYNPPLLVSSLMLVLILLILFTLHEYGHAYAAWKLGDNTAKDLGRLTLNPIPHLDLVGSILLPGILLWQQAGVIFGWAKPVPVNPANFQNPKKDHMRVSFAGPAVNFMVSMVCFFILGFLMLFVRLLWPDTLTLNLATPFSPTSIVGSPAAHWLLFIVIFLRQMFFTSLILGCFNLIPIPPLDGSWIFSGLLPQRLGNLFEKTRRFGWVIFLLLILTPVLDYLLVVPVFLGEMGFTVLFAAMGLS